MVGRSSRNLSGQVIVYLLQHHIWAFLGVLVVCWRRGGFLIRQTEAGVAPFWKYGICAEHGGSFWT